MVKRILLSLALAVLLISLVGCKTIKGAGDDIKSVGSAGEKAVEKK